VEINHVKKEGGNNERAGNMIGTNALDLAAKTNKACIALLVGAQFTSDDPHTNAVIGRLGEPPRPVSVSQWYYSTVVVQ
jgi:hypothetical protein